MNRGIGEHCTYSIYLPVPGTVYTSFLLYVHIVHPNLTNSVVLYWLAIFYFGSRRYGPGIRRFPLLPVYSPSKSNLFSVEAYLGKSFLKHLWPS